MTKRDAELLANYIIQEIKEEFSIIHFSGNLKDTILLEETEDGYDVVITAQLYDVEYFEQHGVIVYDREGSYASEVDKKGGFSRKHRGYINRCINTAIDKWMADNQYEGKVMG